MKKYLLCPGPVASQTDGDFHWVNTHDLMRLYGVRRSECAVKLYGEPASPFDRRLIPLRPRRDGNYTLPEEASCSASV